MRTIVYVDGFNLYYRMLRERPQHKWLNPLALAAAVLKPGQNIIKLNYYIAQVSARAHDPAAPARQATYQMHWQRFRIFRFTKATSLPRIHGCLLLNRRRRGQVVMYGRNHLQPSSELSKARKKGAM